MSGKFNQFSQEDINQLTVEKAVKMLNSAENRFGDRNVGIKRLSENSEINLLAPIKLFTPVTPSILNENQDKSIPKGLPDLSISLSSLEEESINFRPLSTKFDKNKKTEQANEPILQIDKICENFSKSTENSPFIGISLKDFEQQRKTIEEQNRLKKDMLYNTVEVHSQNATADIKRIDQIRTELLKLDNNFATDVSTLRKQIEAVCIHYANIEKQYNQIESQFLKAKCVRKEETFDWTSVFCNSSQ